MDYTQQVSDAMWSVTHTIRRMHNKMDARPPYAEYQRDVMDRLSLHMERHWGWIWEDGDRGVPEGIAETPFS